MPRFLTTLFLLVMAIFLVVFFLANREPVTISFDPLPTNEPAIAFEVPLWAGLSGTLLIGFVLGAMGMWISSTRLRQRSSEHRRRVIELERELRSARESPAPERADGTNLPALQ
ncbi:LapA family protein [Parvularcula lutaonensis]|uniref:Lipopolysaccharide assembly LapA domain-containing protein n=1 Tax=Parvularcula lutaonensis TaxID=491923 RepID=A0ABV7M9R2_9PROT|nr:LapA family protein [Parvularcula lutaonensis]GGY47110.1 hypothetical protein GCM10007148_15450 [Parvularcula lutaonensis]